MNWLQWQSGILAGLKRKKRLAQVVGLSEAEAIGHDSESSSWTMAILRQL